MAAAAITPLLSIVDTWAIRTLPDAHHLGAVGVGTMLFNYVLWGFVFLRFSTVGLAAQALGADDPAEVKRVLVRSVALALVLALVVVAGTLAAFDAVIDFFASSHEVALAARVYVQIRIWSLPAAFVNYVLLAWLLAHRRANLTFALEGLRAVAWVVLVVGFVRGLDQGIAGVAAGATAAEWISLLASGVAVRRLWSGRAGRWRWGEIVAWAPFRRILQISADLFIRTQCLLAAFLGFTASGASFGDVTLAANAVLMNLYLLLAYVVGGFGQVASTLTGLAVGARDGVALRLVIRRTLVAATVGSMVLFAATLAAGDGLIDLLTGIEAVRGEARSYLIYAAALAVLSVGAFLLDGVAIGTTRTALLRDSLLASTVVYGVLHWTLPGPLGNHGTWAAFTGFMTARSVAYLVVLPRLRRAAD